MVGRKRRANAAAATTARAAVPSKEIAGISLGLTLKQREEIRRYAENFGLEPSALVREIQTRLLPALDVEIKVLSRLSAQFEAERGALIGQLRSRLLHADSAGEARVRGNEAAGAAHASSAVSARDSVP